MQISITPVFDLGIKLNANTHLPADSVVLESSHVV